jgi:hypothetical protein
MIPAVDHPNQRDLRCSWRQTAKSWLRRQGQIKVFISHNTVTQCAPQLVS